MCSCHSTTASLMWCARAGMQQDRRLLCGHANPEHSLDVPVGLTGRSRVVVAQVQSGILILDITRSGGWALREERRREGMAGSG